MTGRYLLAASVAIPLAMANVGHASADDLMDEYHAYIGRDDLYNSKGVRLTEPWQIIRQDRANYHKFGIRQRGDEPDNFFSSIANRAKAEEMIRRGIIAPSARSLLLQGGCYIDVKVFRASGGDYLTINVE